ncbi:hypothetical protein Tco_0335885 [Tanacetum coccineum]
MLIQTTTSIIQIHLRSQQLSLQLIHDKIEKKNLSACSDQKIQQNATNSNKSKKVAMDTSSRSGNDAHVDAAEIRPIYNEEPMAEVQMTADDNVSATGQQHTEQPEFINERGDANAEHCQDIWQQSQFLKEKGNEAKVKNDIDVIETINIELEHSVAKLLAENEQLHKENEHLKQTYKDLFDSIKRTRVQTKNQNDSLMEQLNKKSNENADVLAQIQKKRWVPTGKTFASSTTKVKSEPPNGSNADIPNQCESEQVLNVSAGTLLSTGTSFNPTEEGLRVCLQKRKISQKTELQGILI